MPFDGKNYTPPQAELIKRYLVLKDILRFQTDRDQRAYSTCLWSEAKHDHRLVDLGLPRRWTDVFFTTKPNDEQRRFFNDAPLWGSTDVSDKRRWLEREIARLQR